jgi:hypothetical protein
MAVNFSPFAGAGNQFFDNSGNPLAGGLIYTYAAGTTTPAATYTSNTGLTANSNPIVLDSAGRATSEIWLTEGASYKFVLQTALATTLGTYDNVPGVNDFSSLTASGGAALIGATDGAGGVNWTTVQGFINRIISSAGSAYVGFIQAGANAVVRTAQAKMRDRITPEDFGAVGNGSADDTGPFLNALIAAQGKVLKLTGGKSYFLQTWTAYDAALSVTIEGNGATILGPVVPVNFITPAANVNIDSVTFDRWTSVLKRLKAQGGTITQFFFTRNTVLNCTNANIDIECPISNYWITDNLFKDSTGGYAIKIGQNTYADQDNYYEGIVSRNNFFNLSASGSTSCAAMLIYGREVTIEGNIINGVQGAAGEGWGIYTKTRFSTIRGNIIRNIYSTSSSDVVGINVKGTPRSLTTSVQGYNVICSGNQIFNVGVSTVKGSCIRIQTDDVLCTDNLCEDAGLAGIATDDSAGSYDQIIANNKIWFSANASKIGIDVSCNGARIAVRGNDVRNAATGVRVYPIGGALTSAVIENNTLNSVSAGVSITALNNITRLRIANNVVDGGSIGVLNNGGGGVISGLQILDNDMARCSSLFIGDFAVKYLRQESSLTTTDATVTAAFLINLEDSTTHIVEAQIVGAQAASANRAMYWKRALVYRNGGGATIQGAAQSVTADVESNAAWNGAVAVGANLVDAEVTGAAATTINWTSVTQMFGTR